MDEEEEEGEDEMAQYERPVSSKGMGQFAAALLAIAGLLLMLLAYMGGGAGLGLLGLGGLIFGFGLYRRVSREEKEEATKESEIQSTVREQQQPPTREVYREREVIAREIVKVRCRHCGYKFDEASNYCPHCGAPS